MLTKTCILFIWSICLISQTLFYIDFDVLLNNGCMLINYSILLDCNHCGYMNSCSSHFLTVILGTNSTSFIHSWLSIFIINPTFINFSGKHSILMFYPYLRLVSFHDKEFLLLWYCNNITGIWKSLPTQIYLYRKTFLPGHCT